MVFWQPYQEPRYNGIVLYTEVAFLAQLKFGLHNYLLLCYIQESVLQ